MVSSRARKGRNLGTRINDLDSRVTAADARARTPDIDAAETNERLDTLEETVGNLSSSNWRVAQDAAILGDQYAGLKPKELADWNDAKDIGFYWSIGSAANNPVGNIAVGHVLSYGPDGTYNRRMQEVWFPSTATGNMYKSWRRVLDVNSNTWTAWIAIDLTPAGIPTATETVKGIARLATASEATFSTMGVPVPGDIIMSPLRVRDAIQFYAPAASRGGYSLDVSDWNTATKSGFYMSWSGATNAPAGSPGYGYSGIVYSLSVGGDGSGSVGPVVQDLMELNGVYPAPPTVGKTWRRIANNPGGTWSAWSEVATGTTYASGAEVSAGTVSDKAVSPLTLLSRTSSDTRIGLVELATSAETLTGTDSTRAVTPAGVKAVADTKANTVHTHTTSQITDGATAIPALIPVATETVQGKSELATAAEVQAGTDNTRVVTPLGLNGRTATETRTGLVELATTAETTTGTDTVRAVTPAGVKAVADTKAAVVHTHTMSQITDASTAIPAAVPAATQTVQGKIEIATNAEVQAGTDAVRAISPAGLSSRTPTTTRTGLARLATTGEATFVTQGVPVPEDIIMSPQRVLESIRMYAPAADMGQNSIYVTDWNNAKRAGFYVGQTYNMVNGPSVASGVAGFVGYVSNSSTVGDNMGSSGNIMQQVWETLGTFDNSSFGRMWTRIGIDDYPNSSNWSPWVSNQATDTRPGEVELATSAETLTGTDSTRAVTPAGVKAVADTKANTVHTHTTSQITDGATAIPALIPVATETVQGKSELATAAEVQAGTDNTRVVTPLGLNGRTATETRTGLVELATTAETTTGTDTVRAVTPAGLSSRTATESRTGIAELATQAEVNAGTDTSRIVTPATLAAWPGGGAGGPTVYHQGTTAQRDSKFGVPGSVVAAQVALANSRPVWFNTELGWSEAYYALQGSSGLSVPGVPVSSVAGWYPTGPGPMIFMQGTGTGTPASGRTIYNGWSTLTANRRGGVEWFSFSTGGVTINKSGIYRLRMSMSFPTGSTSGVYSLEAKSTGIVVRDSTSKPVTLISTSTQIYDFEIHYVLLYPGDTVYGVSLSGSWTTGSGGTGGARLVVEYVAPALPRD